MASEKRYNNVLNIIDKRLIPNEAAKKARGEVFTPLTLVREMLFGLRKSALAVGRIEIWGVDATGQCIENAEANRTGGVPLEVWRDPDTKWLDPANGIGNFPVVTFYMLDYQLGNHGPVAFRGPENKKKRREHIVTNMLYMIEINKGNINTSRKIFEQMVPDASANICCADTLGMTDAKLMEAFGVNRFDVVMGNPPYNSGGVKSSGKGDGDYETIWPFFLFNSSRTFPGALNIVKENGYVCFIHPSSWLHINDKATVNKALLSHNLQFLRIFTDTQSGELFSGGGMLRTAYYTLQKSAPEDTITVLDTDNILEELSREMIDADEFTIFSNNNTILNKIFKSFNKIGEIKDAHGDPYLKTKGKLKGILSAGKYPQVVSHTLKGVEICKTSVEFPQWNQPKIILKGARNLFHFDDYAGQYGVYGNIAFWIIDSVPNLKKFSQFFDTKLAKIIMNSTKEDQSFIEPKYLPDIRDYEGEITDEALCAYLDIDLARVMSIKDNPNNQKIVSQTNGCFPKGKKTLSAKAGAATAEGGARRSKYGRTRKIRRLLPVGA